MERYLFFLLILISINYSFAGSIYFVHNDHRGAPVMLTDKDAKTVWKADYKPFGDAEIDEDPDGDGKTVELNIRLPGQYYDKETGTLYNYYRDYDPKLGRYIQSDPIGLRGGLNTYGYVSQNPLMYIDPFGLSELLFNSSGNTLTLTNSSGEALSITPAYNNAQSTSDGPFPGGSHPFSWHSPHSGESASSQFGSNGNFIFDVGGGRSGMGVHSGRQGVCDRANRCGAEHATDGCIRTTDSMTARIRGTHYGGDPLTEITVK